MTGTRKVVVSLKCDRCKEVYIDWSMDSLEAIRAKAKTEGWFHRRKEGSDFCDGCAYDVKQEAKERMRPGRGVKEWQSPNSSYNSNS